MVVVVWLAMEERGGTLKIHFLVFTEPPANNECLSSPLYIRVMVSWKNASYIWEELPLPPLQKAKKISGVIWELI